MDENFEIFYAKTDEKVRRLIEKRISEWQEDDIYAISLFVYNEEDDPCRPVAILGYNTERQVQKNIAKASDKQEARWNYAFWLQNEEICLGKEDTAEDVREWITEQDLWECDGDEIHQKFIDMLISVVRDIHASGLLKDKYGREIPILIHGLEYYDGTARQNIDVNGEALDSDFVSFCTGIPCEQEIQNVSQTLQYEVSGPAKKSIIPSDVCDGPDIRQTGNKVINIRFVIFLVVIVMLIIFLCQWT